MSQLEPGVVANPASVTYNGVTLSGNGLHTSFTMSPVKDGTGRTVKYYECNLSVRQIVVWDNSSSASADLEAMRTLLSRPGASLETFGLGYDVSINTGTPGYDAEWGPWPKSIRIQPLGGNVAFEITWEVTFYTADVYTGSGVRNAADSIGKLKELVVDASYQIDEKGLTVRGISGYYVILLHRSSVLPEPGSPIDIPASADDFRDYISVEVPLGFRREGQSWKLSPSKDRMDFSIVDRQLPLSYALPAGITNLELRHTVSTKGLQGNQFGAGLGKWLECQIAGSLEVAYDHSLMDAWSRVLLILQHRLQKAHEAAQNKKSPGSIFITGLSVTENVYGPRKIDFSVQYLVISQEAVGNDKKVGGEGNIEAPTGNLFQRAGMFEVPVSGNLKMDSPEAYQNWRESMKNSWSSRGLAKLSFQSKKERIVSLIDSSEGSGFTDKYRPTDVRNGAGSLRNRCSNLAGQYLQWKSDMYVRSRGGEVQHVALTVESGDFQEPFKSVDHAPMIPVQDSDQIGVLQKVNSIIRIYVTGGALRIGKWPEYPQWVDDVVIRKKVSVSEKKKVTITLADSGLQYGQTEIGGCRVYALRWNYELRVSASGTTPFKELLGAINKVLIVTPADADGDGLIDDPEGPRP